MKKLSIQFHALPDEAGDLLQGLLEDRSLFVTKALGSPLRFWAWSRERDTHANGEQIAFAFTFTPPVLEVGSLHEFRLKNPVALIAQIGQTTPAGLEESWLSAMTENDDAMQRWKKAARQLQNATLIGGYRGQSTHRCHRANAGTPVYLRRPSGVCPGHGDATRRWQQHCAIAAHVALG